MRIGIVGAGGIFEAHARAYQSMGAPLAAVADVDKDRADRAARDFQIPKALNDWRDLVARDDVDVVDVCTPPSLHAPVVIQALEAGKHVVCEKPLAPNLADVDAIAEAAGRSPGKLAVVHQLRFHPAYQRLKYLIDKGHLGRICLARLFHYSSPPMGLVDKGLWGDWRLTGGGVLMTKAIHHLDLLLWMLGPVKRVQAMMGTALYSIQAEDHLVANLEFASGALASLCITGFPYGFKDGMDVVGDRGTVTLPWEIRLKDAAAQARIAAELQAKWPAPGKWQRRWRDALVQLKLRPWTAETQIDHLPFLRAALDAFANKGQVPVSLQEARDGIELCTAIYTAAIQGEVVDLPLPDSTPHYQGITKDDYACAS